MTKRHEITFNAVGLSASYDQLELLINPRLQAELVQQAVLRARRQAA